MMKFLQRSSLILLTFLLVFAGTLPARGADSMKISAEPAASPWEFLHTQNVLKAGEEKLNQKQFLKREEWVRWVLRSSDFVGDGVVKEPFRDVANNSYISKAWRMKAIKAALNFEPNRPVTGAEALKVLLKVKDISTEKVSDKDAGWTDLPEELELRNAVLKAVQLQIWKPESDSELGVNKRLTRAQGAEILFQILTNPPGKKPDEGGTITIKTGRASPEELQPE